MPAGRSLLLQVAAAAGRLLPDWAKAAAYRIPLLSGGVRWILTRAAPEGRVIVEVAGGITQGVRLRLDLKTEKYYWLGTHEIPVQRALARETRPGMVAYDIGAHIGFFTLGLARLVGSAGKVHAFEALPENVHQLQENLSLNASQISNVQVVAAAVTDRCGRVRLDPHRSSSVARVLPVELATASGPEVESITLDEYVFGRGEPAPQLGKMDIEGAEGRALVGARRLLREVRPLWLLEVHSEETARLVWEEFRRADYRLLRLDRAGEYRGPSEIAGQHVLAVPP